MTDGDDGFGPVGIGARALVLVLLAYWAWQMATEPFGTYSLYLLDMTNLVFHEGGHILWMPFGSFLTSLGGSLTQFLVPIVCMVTFLVKTRDPYAAALALWWAGENLVDIAPYVADARALQMILLGGHTGAEVEGHDWEAILTALGWMEHDVTLGHASHRMGILIMIGAIAWGAWILRAQCERVGTVPDDDGFTSRRR